MAPASAGGPVAGRARLPTVSRPPACSARRVPTASSWNRGLINTSEDCLYLNVWTPASSAGEKLPVLVWIYGGGGTSGSTAEPIYDGNAIAKKGVVVVSMNYRVNVFGWFAHPELTKESPHHASGNYGSLDQLAGIQWVKNNIAQFGGDPCQDHDLGRIGRQPQRQFSGGVALAEGPGSRARSPNRTPPSAACSPSPRRRPTA